MAKRRFEDDGNNTFVLDQIAKLKERAAFLTGSLVATETDAESTRQAITDAFESIVSTVQKAGRAVLSKYDECVKLVGKQITTDLEAVEVASQQLAGMLDAGLVDDAADIARMQQPQQEYVMVPRANVCLDWTLVFNKLIREVTEDVSAVVWQSQSGMLVEQEAVESERRAHCMNSRMLSFLTLETRACAIKLDELEKHAGQAALMHSSCFCFATTAARASHYIHTVPVDVCGRLDTDVRTAVLLPDGKTVAVGYNDNYPRISLVSLVGGATTHLPLDTANDAWVRTFYHVWRICLSCNGNLLLLVSHRRGHYGNCSIVEVTMEGSHVATHFHGMLRSFDVKGNVLAVLRLDVRGTLALDVCKLTANVTTRQSVLSEVVTHVLPLDCGSQPIESPNFCVVISHCLKQVVLVDRRGGLNAIVHVRIDDGALLAKRRCVVSSSDWVVDVAFISAGKLVVLTPKMFFVVTETESAGFHLGKIAERACVTVPFFHDKLLIVARGRERIQCIETSEIVAWHVCC